MTASRYLWTTGSVLSFRRCRHNEECKVAPQGRLWELPPNGFRLNHKVILKKGGGEDTYALQ